MYAISNRTVVDPREYVDKKIYFKTWQLVEGLNEDEKAKILGQGSMDDIYCW